MEGKGVLLVATPSIFAEAIIRVLREWGVELVDRVDNLESAVDRLKTHRSGIVIVNREEAGLSEAGIVERLSNGIGECQVVFLAPGDNRMIVHRRQQVPNATPHDLVSVLREGPWPQTEGERQ